MALEKVRQAKFACEGQKVPKRLLTQANQKPVMSQSSGRTGLVNLIWADEYQTSLFYMVGLLVDEVVALPFQKVVELIFVVQMLDGHGETGLTPDTVDGDAFHVRFTDDLLVQDGNLPDNPAERGFVEKVNIV